MTASISKIIDDGVIVGSTLGLVKATNEDVVKYVLKGGILRLCMADGHWGDFAAQTAVEHWMRPDEAFPTSTHEVIEHMQEIENKIFNEHGQDDMDENKDFTPETSVVAIELSTKRLSIASYGDCRLIVARAGKVLYTMNMHETWLGAFSRLGLRKRGSVDGSTVFDSLELETGDTVVVFSDGVDQCIYEEPTISFETIAQYASDKDIQAGFDSIMNLVFEKGAEDNASLAIIRVLAEK